MQRSTLVSSGSVIAEYSREQAIADGALMDVTEAAVDAGFIFPVAMTRAAWEDFVAWTEQDCQRQVFQTTANRLADVLLTLHWTALRSQGNRSRELFFKVYRVPRDTKSVQATPGQLKAVIHAGDVGEAVITIMLPDED